MTIENGVCLSVIIPAYNVEMYVESCLESVLLQNISNMEVLCIDDGSTDGTKDLLKKYAKLDSRIRVIENEENKGTAYSRNIGLDNANGKYIYFLDSDDLIKPHTLKKLIAIAENESLDCIYFCSEIQDEDHIGDLKLKFDIPGMNDVVYSGKELFRVLMNNNSYSGSVCRQFWKHSFLKENKLYFPNGLWGEDAEFSVKSMLLVGRAMCLNEALHIYRRHGGSMSTNISPYKTVSLFKIYCNLLVFWSLYNWDDETNNCFDKYMQIRLQQVKRLYFRNLNKISETDFTIGMERHLYNNILGKLGNDIDYTMSKEELLQISTYKCKYIYGAGVLATDIYQLLKNNNISVDGIVVTKKQTNTTTICDLPLFDIDELLKNKVEKDKICFVIGVKNRQNVENIMQELQVRGIQNVFIPRKK